MEQTMKRETLERRMLRRAAADRAAYRTLCHHPGGFDSAVRAIRLLRARGIDVKINGSVTRQNLADMEAIYALGRELGAPVFETGFSSAWTRCSSRFWRWRGG